MRFVLPLTIAATAAFGGCSGERSSAMNRSVAPDPTATARSESPGGRDRSKEARSPSRPDTSTRHTAGRDAGALSQSTAPDDDVDAMLDELERDDATRIREIPRCLALRGKDRCTGVGKVMLVCTGLGNILTPEPTARFLACLEAKNGTEDLCGTQALEDCALSALDGTPQQSGTRQSCRQLIGQCDVEPKYEKYFTQARCASGLAALRRVPRDDFVACMRKRCDLRLCVSGLL